MSVSVDIHQQTCVVDGPLYRVKTTIVDATGISTALFVFKTVDDTFDHYATVADLTSWPDNKADAITGSLAFYRQPVLERDWPTVNQMNQDLLQTVEAIQMVVDGWDAANSPVAVAETTTLRQERHVEYIGAGTQSFIITSYIDTSDVGELPHPFVFVFTIADRSDPKADTFARVAMLADLTTLPKGRDAGLAAQAGVGIEYLNTSVVASYADLATAVAAEQAFKDSVSSLVSDWITYSGSFVASPTAEYIGLPLVSATTKAALLAAYKAAKQDSYAKGITANTATDALTAAQTAYTTLNNDVTQLQTITAALSAAATALSTTVADLTTLQTQASTLAPTPMASAISAALVAENVDGAKATAAAAAVTPANAFLSSKQSALAAALVAVNNAVTANTGAQQASSDAQATMASALLALLAVCPDFDTTTVCSVAG
jgi:hypothetical protein